MKLGVHVVNESVDLPQNNRGPIITPPQFAAGKTQANTWQILMPSALRYGTSHTGRVQLVMHKRINVTFMCLFVRSFSYLNQTDKLLVPWLQGNSNNLLFFLAFSGLYF